MLSRNMQISQTMLLNSPWRVLIFLHVFYAILNNRWLTRLARQKVLLILIVWSFVATPRRDTSSTGRGRCGSATMMVPTCRLRSSRRNHGPVVTAAVKIPRGRVRPVPPEKLAPSWPRFGSKNGLASRPSLTPAASSPLPSSLPWWLLLALFASSRFPSSPWFANGITIDVSGVNSDLMSKKKK